MEATVPIAKEMAATSFAAKLAAVVVASVAAEPETPVAHVPFHTYVPTAESVPVPATLLAMTALTRATASVAPTWFTLLPDTSLQAKGRLILAPATAARAEAVPEMATPAGATCVKNRCPKAS